jgi:hypothetical protein
MTLPAPDVSKRCRFVQAPAGSHGSESQGGTRSRVEDRTARLSELSCFGMARSSLTQFARPDNLKQRIQRIDATGG